MKRKNILILAMMFLSAIGYSQNADPGVNINMNPASLSLYTTGLLDVNVCNNGITPIVPNSIRVVVSVGPNAEILGIQGGSDPRFGIFSLDMGPGNTMIMTNNGVGNLGFLDCANIDLIVKAKVVFPASTITSTVSYITGTNPLLGGAQNSSQGNLATGNDNSTTSLTVTPFLPIVLESFDAKLVDCKTQLSWKTSAEVNLKNYEIEMSSDGINFEIIGTIGGKGKQGNGSSYSYSHDANNGTIYYRLKSVDLNGSHAYSNVVNVKKDCGKRKVSIYPNPVVDQLKVEISNSSVEELGQSIGVLYNAAGVEVGRYNLNHDTNYIRVSDFTSGVYILKVTSKELSETFEVVVK